MPPPLDAQAKEILSPDFIAPIYGPLNTVTPPANPPPLFAAIASDDPLFGRTDFGLVQAWRQAGGSTELHVYQKGDHGFGMRKQGTTSDLWIDQYAGTANPGPAFVSEQLARFGPRPGPAAPPPLPPA